MAEKRKKRAGTGRPRRTGTGSSFLIMLVAVVVVLLAIVVGFRVTDFEITGNRIYTDAEIQEASSVETGENILLLQRSGTASSILASLPYVESVRISRDLPGTVYIEVTEGTAAAAIADTGGDWWLISTEGKLMEQITEEEAGTYTRISGETVQLPEAGDMMRLTGNTEGLPELLTALDDAGVSSGITLINIQEDGTLVLWYGEQYQILLGNAENLTYKVQFFVTVLQNLDADQTGQIDLTFSEDEAAHFHPWQ